MKAEIAASVIEVQNRESTAIRSRFIFHSDIRCAKRILAREADAASRTRIREGDDDRLFAGRKTSVVDAVEAELTLADIRCSRAMPPRRKVLTAIAAV
jgi:hypothetical protein